MILEEAAQCDPGEKHTRDPCSSVYCYLFCFLGGGAGFFYEVVAPLLLVGRTSLICISTLTSSFNFYSRLFKMVDPATKEKIFYMMQIRLACDDCIRKEKSDCVHNSHLIPTWQSSVRHERLLHIMADRPDLIKSELAGVAVDPQQSIFRSSDIALMFDSNEPIPKQIDPDCFICVDPAAGGPGSDYAILSFIRWRGQITIIGAEVLDTKHPEKQHALLEAHINRIRQMVHFRNSRVIVYVERNLGNEAEFHRYSLRHMDRVYFREDPQHPGRIGILTTEAVKHSASTLLDIYLRERRLSIEKAHLFVSNDVRDVLERIREQLHVFSLQFKAPKDTFEKLRVAISGKLAGCKDDLVMTLLLGVWFTDLDASNGGTVMHEPEYITKN